MSSTKVTAPPVVSTSSSGSLTATTVPPRVAAAEALDQPRLGALPDGAVVADDHIDGQLRTIVITLPGSANANTAGAPGATAAPGTHWATAVELSIATTPMARSPRTAGARTTFVPLGSTTGMVTAPQGSAGRYEIAWTARHLYFRLAQTRLSTQQGLSGIPLDAMIAVARGVA